MTLVTPIPATSQIFSLSLAKKAHELTTEKRKADKLLLQMLPPTVARRVWITQLVKKEFFLCFLFPSFRCLKVCHCSYFCLLTLKATNVPKRPYKAFIFWNNWYQLCLGEFYNIILWFRFCKACNSIALILTIFGLSYFSWSYSSCNMNALRWSQKCKNTSVLG